MVKKPLVKEPLVKKPLVKEPLVKEPLLKKPLVKPPIVKPVVPCPGGDDDDDESSCTPGSKLRKAIPPAVKPRVIKDALVKPVRTPVFEVMPPPR